MLTGSRGLDASRVHKYDPSSALADVAKPFGCARKVIQGIARNDGVGAEDHQELGVLDVWIRQAHRRTVHVFVDTKLVHRVAGAGAIHTLRADACE